jgi:hypothetical protein
MAEPSNFEEEGNGAVAVMMPELRRRKGFDRIFRHPWARLFISGIIAILNFIMLAEDPVAHSRAEADVPIVGDGISFILARYPDTAALRFLKVSLWLLSIVAGIAIGFLLHRFLLQRLLKIRMFEGTHGSWTVMFFTSIPVVFVGSRIYTAFLKIGSGNESYYISSLMGTSNKTFMAVAAIGTWLGDFITFLMVLDMCLQQTNEYVGWMPAARRWWNRGWNRVVAFWGVFVTFTIIVVTFILTEVIDHDESFGDSLAPSNEVGRTLLAAVITVMDLMIVAGDWDFPTFDNPFEIKLPGFNVPEIDIKWLSSRLRLPEFFEISISGRWFNYGIILVVMCLDFNMMKNQIVYEPFAFGQYTDPDGHIWTVEKTSDLTGATEEQISWAVRGGEASGDSRMQARYVDAPYALRMLAATPAFLGLLVFIIVSLRGVRGKDRKIPGTGLDAVDGGARASGDVGDGGGSNLNRAGTDEPRWTAATSDPLRSDADHNGDRNGDRDRDRNGDRDRDRDRNGDRNNGAKESRQSRNPNPNGNRGRGRDNSAPRFVPKTSDRARDSDRYGGRNSKRDTRGRGGRGRSSSSDDYSSNYGDTSSKYAGSSSRERRPAPHLQRDASDDYYYSLSSSASSRSRYYGKGGGKR